MICSTVASRCKETAKHFVNKLRRNHEDIRKAITRPTMALVVLPHVRFKVGITLRLKTVTAKKFKTYGTKKKNLFLQISSYVLDMRMVKGYNFSSPLIQSTQRLNELQTERQVL